MFAALKYSIIIVQCFSICTKPGSGGFKGIKAWLIYVVSGRGEEVYCGGRGGRGRGKHCPHTTLHLHIYIYLHLHIYTYIHLHTHTTYIHKYTEASVCVQIQ